MARRHEPNLSDSRRYYDWLEVAGEDLSCARILLSQDSCYNMVAFHCQQTIEKALKSYILLKSGQLMDGHNLTWLCKRAMRYDREFDQWLDECAALNHCYIETRYPADIPLALDYPDVNQFHRMAKEMYLFICAEVDEILEKKASASSNSTKKH